ncbi:hypothetical protein [Actinoplanes sp. N902-109]|uniref:hypothetical protein n=1 Tax=Actinoplanes sp. (strain N902-109) TaxID=649831 RepID=UPI0003294E01|nr:hypothetical protein [Actinoplanes sp. N902-109]AGL17813.1 hypothetical protein L083_4303 [Actinoplanes sp. N902-109]
MGSPELYVARDKRATMVSRLRLTVVDGGATTERWGGVLEVAPAVPAGATLTGPGVWTTSVILVVGALGFACSGARWWPLIALAGVVVGVAGSIRGPGARLPGTVSAPQLVKRRDEHYVLEDTTDRQSFDTGLSFARRAWSTWPALGALVDAPAAERLLTRALLDLAEMLERRQRVRRIHTELAAYETQGLAADNPAVRKLHTQRATVAQALDGWDTAVSSRLASLEAAAVTAETFLREQEIKRATATFEGRFFDPTIPAGPDAAAELVAGTAAVLEAYRELDARYGPDVEA